MCTCKTKQEIHSKIKNKIMAEPISYSSSELFQMKLYFLRGIRIYQSLKYIYVVSTVY